MASPAAVKTVFFPDAILRTARFISKSSKTVIISVSSLDGTDNGILLRIAEYEASCFRNLLNFLHRHLYFLQ